jgi:CheY-like chemotaxis protein
VHGYFSMGYAKDQAITVLLVEDEGIIRMASSAMLEDAGYIVIEASDANEALQILRQHPQIDIVITDVQMPGTLDGLGLVEILGREYPHIEALITSGRTCVNDAQKAGAKKFLSKPYTAADMQNAVEAALERA